MTSRNPFCVGAARADITPPVGTCLYGYTPDFHSTSIHDPLAVTALALAQNGASALMITIDLGDLQTELNEEIRAILAGDCGIPIKHILLSCTHTHGAPNLSGVAGWGDIDRPYYRDIFLPGIRKAAKEAFAALAPAEFSIGTTQSQVGINRREQLANGSVILGQNPYGCYDPTMTVLAFRNAETHEGILNLIHYGCHGTSQGCNPQVTRDWSGVMVDRMQTQTGTLTAFWNGACGDVGPRLTNGKTVGDIHHTEELGGVAAMDAMRAYQARGGYHAGKLALFCGQLRLPHKQLPDADYIAQKLASYTDSDSLNNLNRLEYAYYCNTAEILKTGEIPPEALYLPQTLLCLGDVLFIPFAWEMFSEITMRLRSYTGYTHTLCLSNTNGYYCYLPSQDQLCRGGYEVNCFLYASRFPLADNTDQHIINENLRILREHTT